MMEDVLRYEKNLDDDLYHILGCDESSNSEQILTEYKARVLGVHPDKNPDNPHALDQFKRLQRAKEILCNPETRANYDAWRNSGLAVSYDRWLSLKDSVHTSMHWATKVKKEPMIEDSHIKPKEWESTASSSGGTTVEQVKAPPQWKREPANNDVLRKFRNYQI